jgi:sugar lactone lactonase YvrE
MEMSENRVELAVDAHCQLGEGPAYFYDRLWWVDILGKRIHEYDPKTGEHHAHIYSVQVTAVVPRQGGGFVLATEDGFALLDHMGGKMEFVMDPEKHLPGNRFNDGKCDPRGRLWAGTMAREGAPQAGALYVLGQNLIAEHRVPHVSCSNGLAWSSDGRTMYYIDTPTGTVDAFSYEPETGAIANRQPVIRIPDGNGYPDGMTIDAEGKLWVATWDGWSVLRCDPVTGNILEKIPVPVAQVTSCAFGGPNLSDLYITSARAGVLSDDIEQQPHAGGLFRLRTTTHGLPTVAFAG